MDRNVEDQVIEACLFGPEHLFWVSSQDSPHLTKAYKAGFSYFMFNRTGHTPWVELTYRLDPGFMHPDAFQNWLDKYKVDIGRFLKTLAARDSTLLDYSGAQLRLLKQIDQELEGVDEKVVMYLTGGAAVNYYTDGRATEDIDAVFNKKVLLSDFKIAFTDSTGAVRQLYVDKNFNDTFALMHENYQQDAIEAHFENVTFKNLDVRVINPVDLAVSKIARMNDKDIADINALRMCGLIKADAVRQRAEEAIGGYVGNLSSIKSNINHIVNLIGPDRSVDINATTGKVQKPF
ncbi:DUF6036 family nucleotidyltransferase [Methylobacillus sp. Pita2]|uniref:DUF6036 family nucleotidyltransferase n=1 Tax=Methylobacillus sp. Pita2 TaxID=3383245 RepID=UPI0038B541CA